MSLRWYVCAQMSCAQMSLTASGKLGSDIVTNSIYNFCRKIKINASGFVSGDISKHYLRDLSEVNY